MISNPGGLIYWRGGGKFLGFCCQCVAGIAGIKTKNPVNQ